MAICSKKKWRALIHWLPTKDGIKTTYIDPHIGIVPRGFSLWYCLDDNVNVSISFTHI